MATPFYTTLHTNQNAAALCVSYTNMNIEIASKEDGEFLASLRVLAMRESLEAIGRFDPVRARERFLSKFDPSKTEKVITEEGVVAFFVLTENKDHYYLDHLYVTPEYQGREIGSRVLELIKERSAGSRKPIRLGALKGSRSNDFYMSHGFVFTHEEEFDKYYELGCRS